MGHSGFSEDQKQSAINLYKSGYTLTQVVNALGYPTIQSLTRWIENEGCLRSKKHFHQHSAAEKMEIIRRCFTDGENVESIAKEYDVSVSSIYKWSRKYRKGGATQLTSKKKYYKKLSPVESVEKSTSDVESLKAQMQEMQMEIDILKETIEVLKKDPGVDLNALKNREKAVIVDALRKKYSLPKLLKKVNLSRSCYYYNINALANEDKYLALRKHIRELFKENKCRYGYRRIHSLLKQEGIVVSEKVVRKIMREENLNVVFIKMKKYSSYLGEISPAVDDLVKRNFHAKQPNVLWLTDITEFHIPAGKVYLSPMIDCFDGLPVAWTIGTSPNSLLANEMLDNAIATLKGNEHPIVHSDRGAHYRWPGWICRMEKAGLTRSMSKKGCSPDNAACEGFHGRLKNEFFYNQDWSKTTIDEFVKLLNEYIHWYAEERIKISLGGLSPLAFRKKLGLIA